MSPHPPQAKSKLAATLCVRLAAAAAGLLFAAAVGADEPSAHRVGIRPMQFGVSGSPINAGYSGTLGSLISAGGHDYILSTWTVLADAGQVALGSEIEQPANTDGGRGARDSVGELSFSLPLVDAALAELDPGVADSKGTILGIGEPSATVGAPMIGSGIAKSGRTTGVTCGKVSAISMTLLLCVRPTCGVDRDSILLKDVFVAESAAVLGAPGDTGSLVVGSDSARPMGLMVASSGQPGGTQRIYAVAARSILREFARVSDLPDMTFVGGSDHRVQACPTSAATPVSISKETYEAWTQDKDQLVEEFLVKRSLRSAVGVGLGLFQENRPCILVYVASFKKTGLRSPTFSSPRGFQVLVIETGAVTEIASP